MLQIQVAWPTSITNSVFLLAIVATPINCTHYCMHALRQQDHFLLMHAHNQPLMCIRRVIDSTIIYIQGA